MASSAVQFRDESDLCIPTSISNALSVLRKADLAAQHWAYFKHNCMKFDQTGALGFRVRDHFDAQKHLNSREVILQHKPPDTASVRYITEEVQSGVFVLSLEGTSNSKHSVCVSVDYRLIFDSMEAVPLCLCCEAIMACVGDEVLFLGIREIGAICIPGVKEKGKSRRRFRDPVKKRRKRNAAARPSRESASQK